MQAPRTADGLADQIRSIIQAELAERVAQLDRRERDLVEREEGLKQREQALAAAETPTPARALFQAPAAGGLESSSNVCAQTAKTGGGYARPAKGAGRAPHLQAKLFQAPPADAEEPQEKDRSASKVPAATSALFQVASAPAAAPGAAVAKQPESLFQDLPQPQNELLTTSAGTASQLKDRFEQKAGASAESRQAPPQGIRPHRHSMPAGKPTAAASSEKPAAEFAEVSAGTANELKDMFEQRAQQARKDSDTPERKGSWRAVQNRLELPNSEGTGLFRAHEAPFRRGVKTVGLGQPRERRSLQELLKADEMCQMAR